MSKNLIIDDYDKDFQEATRIVLEKHNFEVASAYHPEEGRKRYSVKDKVCPADVVLQSRSSGRHNCRLDLKHMLITNIMKVGSNVKS